MTDTVTPTEQDFAIALRGLWMQAKAHGVEITWEVRDFLIFESENVAVHYAWSRFYNKIINSELSSETHRAILKGAVDKAVLTYKENNLQNRIAVGGRDK